MNYFHSATLLFLVIGVTGLMSWSNMVYDASTLEQIDGAYYQLKALNLKSKGYQNHIDSNFAFTFDLKP